MAFQVASVLLLPEEWGESLLRNSHQLQRLIKQHCAVGFAQGPAERDTSAGVEWVFRMPLLSWRAALKTGNLVESLPHVTVLGPWVPLKKGTKTVEFHSYAVAYYETG